MNLDVTPIFDLPHSRFFMIFFLLGLVIVQMCCEDIKLVGKTFLFKHIPFI